MYQSKGYTVKILSLSAPLLILTCSYLNPLERFKVKHLCRQVELLCEHPSLWREVSIYQR